MTHPFACLRLGQEYPLHASESGGEELCVFGGASLKKLAGDPCLGLTHLVNVTSRRGSTA